MNVLLFVVLVPLLATSAVEVIDFAKVSLLARFQSTGDTPRLVGPISYGVLYSCLLLAISAFYVYA